MSTECNHRYSFAADEIIRITVDIDTSSVNLVIVYKC